MNVESHRQDAMNALRKILIKTDDSHFDIHVQHRRGGIETRRGNVSGSS